MMARDAGVLQEAPQAQILTSRSPRELAWRRFKKNKVGIAALVTSIFFVSCAVLAPVIAWAINIDPNERDSNAITARGQTIGRFGGISWNHPLGVEPGIGYDILARLIYGARISFLVAAIATLTTVFVGLMIGVVAGYFRGRTDSVLGRLTDFLLAFPSFFMIIALSAPMIARIEKSGLARDNSARVIYLILVLALFGWPYFSRIMRSQALSLRERDFVLASRALGASHSRIIFKELLPNLWTPVIVYLSLALPGYLAAEAIYSYLGIGVQPPAATWGLLISDSIKYVMTEPTYFLIPSLSLILVVLSFNLLGDAVRDALDPKSELT
jgi:ABC-type dipeptide/oligopeptide/nickel transport system permease subunit